MESWSEQPEETPCQYKIYLKADECSIIDSREDNSKYPAAAAAGAAAGANVSMPSPTASDFQHSLMDDETLSKASTPSGN